MGEGWHQVQEFVWSGILSKHYGVPGASHVYTHTHYLIVTIANLDDPGLYWLINRT